MLEAEYWSFVGARKLTPLLVNVACDGVVLYDRYGKLSDFLLRIKRGLERVGGVRKRQRRFYYWMLPKPGAKLVLEP